MYGPLAGTWCAKDGTSIVSKLNSVIVRRLHRYSQDYKGCQLNTSRSHTWQDIQDRIRSNIEDRTWSPGDLIPGEVALAEQFGCARTTVNRALRELAATGVIDRKRKAGTRVAIQKTRRVTAEIPVIREQVERNDQAYRFSILEYRMLLPPQYISETLGTSNKTKLLHLRSVHFADELPFIYEDRWINTKTIKEVKNVDLAQTSANEWLVQNVPFTNGEFLLEASVPNQTVVKALQLAKDEPVLGSRRTTWLADQSVTTVSLYYVPGYQMRFEI